MPYQHFFMLCQCQCLMLHDNLCVGMLKTDTLHRFVFMLYQDIYFYCIVFSLFCCISIYVICQPNKLIWYQNLPAVFFTFSITQYSEKLPSLAVACGPTTPQDFKVRMGLAFSLLSICFVFSYDITSSQVLCLVT